MQNRKRLTNILIAGTLTVLMLTVFLAFRGTGTAVAETAVVETAVVQTLLAEIERLRLEIRAKPGKAKGLKEVRISH